MCLLKKIWSSRFSWLLILPWVTSVLKFNWNSSSRSEDMNSFFFNINYFHQFFQIFIHFLVSEKLMTSAYNRWHKHFLPSAYFKPTGRKYLQKSHFVRVKFFARNFLWGNVDHFLHSAPIKPNNGGFVECIFFNNTIDQYTSYGY